VDGLGRVADEHQGHLRSTGSTPLSIWRYTPHRVSRVRRTTSADSARGVPWGGRAIFAALSDTGRPESESAALLPAFPSGRSERLWSQAPRATNERFGPGADRQICRGVGMTEQNHCDGRAAETCCARTQTSGNDCSRRASYQALSVLSKCAAYREVARSR
jgi:hypothetical protein